MERTLLFGLALFATVFARAEDVNSVRVSRQK